MDTGPLHAGRWAADALWLRTAYHFPCVHAQRGISVELHAEPAPYYMGVKIPFDELWARAVPVSLAGRLVAGLSPEDAMLVACVHGAKHAWNSLDMVRGAALLARRHGMDWNALLERAAEAGLRRILLLGLALARDLAGAPVPAPVKEALEADAAATRKLVEAVRQGLFQFAGPAFANLPRFHLLCRERRRDRLLDMLRLAAPNSDDLEWLPLPRRLFPLYWLLRPVRVLVAYAAPAARWLRARAQPSRRSTRTGSAATSSPK